MYINGQTRLCLLLGNPVEHSLSPALHNAGFSALGLNYVYLAAHVEGVQVGAAVKGLRALSVAGANVTSPHKEAVIPYLDSVSSEAKIIQSVNTIVNRRGNLFGTTTDGFGLFQSIKQSAPDYDIGQPVMIIGAGGAARAAAYTLAKSGISEMFIANRSIAKAESLTKTIIKHTELKKCTALPLREKEMQSALACCRLFVYTLPTDNEIFIGALCKSSMPFKKAMLCDLRYSPAETAVIKYFGKLGGRAINGMGMLLWQAVSAFEHFTGTKAPVKVMQEVIER